MKDEPAPRSLWGRVVVLGAFWSVVAWGGIALLGSIVATLYGRPPAMAGDDAALYVRQHAWCLRTLAGLRDELEAEITHELTHPNVAGEASPRYTTWNEHWLMAFEDAAARCSADAEPRMADAFSALRELHHGYTHGLVQITRSRADAGEEIRAHLRALTGRQPTHGR